MRKIGYFLTLALFWVSGATVAVPLDIDSVACTSGTGTNGIAVSDVTGNNGGATQCYGTIDGNDPGPSADGIETGGMIFEFITKVDIADNGDLTIDPSGTGIGISLTYDSGVADATGTWSYDSSPFSAEAFIIVIKAANTPGWAAWLFEGTHATSTFGDWLIAWEMVPPVRRRLIQRRQMTIAKTFPTSVFTRRTQRFPNLRPPHYSAWV